jgi:hypothetical protein
MWRDSKRSRRRRSIGLNFRVARVAEWSKAAVNNSTSLPHDQRLRRNPNSCGVIGTTETIAASVADRVEIQNAESRKVFSQLQIADN